MWRGRVRTIALLAVAAVALTGCELRDNGDNLENGKTLFNQKCASCHTLARANAKGVVGPNLDEAFQQADKDGFGRSTFQGIVHKQILHPNLVAQVDPATGKSLPLMPPGLVTGEDAEDVAAYVAQAAAAGGKDPGRLADIGNEANNKVAKEANGKLEIPADPTGATKYQYGSAEATSGQLTIESKNDSSTDHDIAIEGNGVNEKGDVVKDGGVSTINADLKPGDYTFYCTVPGHREGGMEGKLTVK
jgi:mono/diheme cytochrome c family protein